MKLRLTISACCLFFSLVSFAQRQLILKEKIKIPTTQRKVVNTLIDDSKGGFIRIFEQNSSNKPLNGTIIERQQGLIFSNGKEFFLQKNERVVSTAESQFLTIVPYGSESSVLKKYSVNRQSVSLVGQKSFSSIELWPELLRNGTIIISDEVEGFGTQVEIYSGDFKLLNIYKPFEQGFERGVFDFNNGKVVYAFKNQNNIKLAIFNATTGKLINEGVHQLDISLQVIHSFSDYVLIYGSGSLVCLDLSGKILWRSAYDLPSLDIYHDNAKTLFLFTSTDLLCIKAPSGNLNWKKNFNELVTAGQKPSMTQLIRPISFGVDEESINLILSLTKKGTVSNEDKKFNNHFISIKNNGFVESKVFLSNEAKLLTIKELGPELQIIQDDEILKYEK